MFIICKSHIFVTAQIGHLHSNLHVAKCKTETQVLHC